MLNYNPEDLKLWNEFAFAKRHQVCHWASQLKYSIEDSFSKEEKIEAIDTYASEPGILTYAIDLLAKWNKDKKDLPKDNDGWVRTNSLKAWLHKNDPKKLVDDWYHYGSFTIYHETFGLEQRADRPEYDLTSDEHLNKLFHKFCEEQVIAEECIYLERDPKAIKFEKIRSLTRAYDIFGTQMLCDFRHNLDSEEIEGLDEAVMDKIIAAYEEFKTIWESFNNRFIQISKEANWREDV